MKLMASVGRAASTSNVDQAFVERAIGVGDGIAAIANSFFMFAPHCALPKEGPVEEGPASTQEGSTSVSQVNACEGEPPIKRLRLEREHYQQQGS
jgi:hypothetical protein